MKEKTLTNFLEFLDRSPTSYHAVEELKKKLLKESFIELDEKKGWDLKASGKYFIINGGALIAFIVPKGKIEDTLILSSHTDSPALKLKPKAEFVKEGMTLLGVEVYGAPLLSSWLNRDLGIAGKVLYQNKKGQVDEKLINLTHSPVTIPQIAIHLDRKVNDDGLILNKQEHLNALVGLAKDKSFLSSQLGHEVLTHELFLYPLEKSQLLGDKGELIASYRLDSLASVFSIAEKFLEKKPSQNTLTMMTLWDHEEIGSGTTSGAESPFFLHTLERILLAFELSRDDYIRLLKNSFSVSVDLGHAVNPNYVDKHDAHHKSALGCGVLIKTSAQKRYATETSSVKKVVQAALQHKIPHQFVVPRNDIPCGTTVGPIHATLTGIPTVDIGIGQLSMHSARELIATKDLFHLMDLIEALLK